MSDLIPDSTGTIYIKGHEETAKEFLDQDRGIKTFTKQRDALKNDFRARAEEALRSAQGAKRVFFHAKGGGGIGATCPDYGKDANRGVVSDKVMKAINKAGGLEAAGLDGSIYETAPGGEPSIVLTGRLVAWFMSTLVDSGKLNREDPDLQLNIDVQPRYRLTPQAASELQEKADHPVVKHLLSSLKSVIIKGEDE